MDIPAISSGGPSTNPQPNQSAGADAKIKSLEQQLQKLNAERQKAIRRKDGKQKEKIEKQIQEIEKQLQQLRQQEKKRTQGTGKDESNEKKHLKIHRIPGNIWMPMRKVFFHQTNGI